MTALSMPFSSLHAKCFVMLSNKASQMKEPHYDLFSHISSYTDYYVWYNDEFVQTSWRHFGGSWLGTRRLLDPLFRRSYRSQHSEDLCPVPSSWCRIYIYWRRWWFHRGWLVWIVVACGSWGTSRTHYLHVWVARTNLTVWVVWGLVLVDAARRSTANHAWCWIFLEVWWGDAVPPRRSLQTAVSSASQILSGRVLCSTIIGCCRISRGWLTTWSMYVYMVICSTEKSGFFVMNEVWLMSINFTLEMIKSHTWVTISKSYYFLMCRRSLLYDLSDMNRVCTMRTKHYPSFSRLALLGYTY